MASLLPGMNYASPTGIEGLAYGALQDPGSVANQFAIAGIPPPTMPQPGVNNQLGQLLSGLGGMTGSQGPTAVPGAQYGASVGGPGLPGVPGISGASGGINAALQRMAPQGSMGGVPTLGALIRQGTSQV